MQIFGSDAAVMAEAATMVEAAGADILDMNFGCPVPKVTKTGAGATLLEEPHNAAAIVSAVRDAVDIPVTVKMRRGLRDGSRAALDVGPRLVDAGASALTLHPRSAKADVYGSRRPRPTASSSSASTFPSSRAVMSPATWTRASCSTRRDAPP